MRLYGKTPMAIRTTGVIAIACTIAWLTGASLRGDGLGEPTTASKPKLADLMWLHGQWRGQIKGDVIEEYWSKPSADSMTGMFRWLTGGNKTRLFEFLTITQEPSGLTFRFKHFSRDLKGWEEKDESWDFPVATLGEREAVFEKPNRQKMRRVIYRIEDSGGLLIRVEGYTDGKLEAEEFRFRRVE